MNESCIKWLTVHSGPESWVRGGCQKLWAHTAAFFLLTCLLIATGCTHTSNSIPSSNPNDNSNDSDQEEPLPGEDESDIYLFDVDTNHGDTADGNDNEAACPRFKTGIILGTAKCKDLIEASGLAASRRSPHILWSHNDSGGTPSVFALKTDGTHLGVFTLQGVDAYDEEDMAADDEFLYLGDIGDNGLIRETIVIYRFPEPLISLDQTPVDVVIEEYDTLTLAYPDGPKDAETLLVDPTDSSIYIVTKSEQQSRVYRVPTPIAWNGETSELELVVEKLPLLRLTTAGDISPDGDMIIIRDYTRAVLWQRLGGDTIAKTLTHASCNVPVNGWGQEEAICFHRDGTGYFTIPEKTILSKSTIRFYEKK